MFKFLDKLKPKIVKINLEQKYFDGICSPTMTCTPYYYWVGQQHVKWLWWEFIRNFEDFEIFDKQVIFKRVLPKDTIITFTYFCDI